MKSLYDVTVLNEVKGRMAGLRPDTQRQWGKMTAAQMLAHCSAAMETAVGDVVVPRLMIGRVLGPLVKAGFSNDKPLHRNGPTAPQFLVSDARELSVERERLEGLLERFQAGGSQGCTKHPHCFFGELTPEQWGKGMYKHLDHHLMQFGV